MQTPPSQCNTYFPVWALVFFREIFVKHSSFPISTRELQRTLREHSGRLRRYSNFCRSGLCTCQTHSRKSTSQQCFRQLRRLNFKGERCLLHKEGAPMVNTTTEPKAKHYKLITIARRKKNKVSTPTFSLPCQYAGMQRGDEKQQIHQLNYLQA